MRIRVRHTGNGGSDVAVTVTRDARLEAFVGEAVAVFVVEWPLPSTIEVASKPEGATPTVDGENFTADQPGVYRILIRCGTQTGHIELVAVPCELLDDPALAQCRGPDAHLQRPTRDRRLIVRSLVRDPHALAPAALQALTPAAPLPSNVDLRIFGA